jgi:hypothetical protein
MASRKARILVLCKTYPSPSGKHVETSCVAGMEDDGSLIRLFPVPFRLVSDELQFKKWQWIDARVEKAASDRRRESHRIFVDTITCDAKPLSTKDSWQARRTQLAKLSVFTDFAALDAARAANGVTLGLLKPSDILTLDITPADRSDWTDLERQKLVQHERQTGLFEQADAKRIRTLRKVPFDFHYRYSCAVGQQTSVYRHKIADWEAGALYWNCRHRHGDGWEAPFRAKLGGELPASDLMLLMGTIHRFPDQWLIVSLIYPPMPRGAPPDRQSSLDL